MTPECVLAVEDPAGFKAVQNFAQITGCFITARTMTWDTPPVWRITLWDMTGNPGKAGSYLYLDLANLPGNVTRLR